ncbi:MAG: hypothetical protein ACJ72Z_13760 [Pyrinomonadaceae bacterium]
MRDQNRLWITIGGCVVIALVIIYLFKVNPPPVASVDLSQSSNVPIYTAEGPIATGSLKIEPGSFLQYRVNFNRRATVKGKFQISSGKPRIGCLILTESDFEKWREGGEFQAAVSTGSVPSGKIHRVLTPGVYYLVLDNRLSIDKPAAVELDFAVE